MKINFTRNSLVQYLFKETSLEKSIQITEVLSMDENVRAEYDQMCEGYKQLESIKLNPSAKSIENILAFSKNQLIEA